MTPIKPENRALYPAKPEWQAIREELAIRAGDKCEQCKKPHNQTVTVGTLKGGEGVWQGPHHRNWYGIDGEQAAPAVGGTTRHVRVICTVAHLDHDPTNNGEPGNRPNLKFLCQRCHNSWDQEHRVANRKATMAAKRELAAEAGTTEPVAQEGEE